MQALNSGNRQVVTLALRASGHLKNGQNNMSTELQSNQPRSSVFWEGVVIEGEGISGKALVFGGDLIGDISVETLVISDSGTVTGDIRAQFLKIAGKFDGTAIAEEIIVTDTARITGKIVAQTLTIDPGAEIMGEISRKSNVQPIVPSASLSA